MQTRGERKAGLVEAAYQSIAQHGLEGLRLRTVADQVGIDHSTLHHHFATKQQLVAAVVERATAPLRTTMPVAGTSGGRLREHLQSLARMIEASPDLFVVLAEIDLRARRDAETRRIIEEVERGWRRALADVLGSRSEAVELVIAAVKGVRLRPEAAPAVLELVADLLESRSGGAGRSAP
jgi:AcrR family transcriptional regulator